MTYCILKLSFLHFYFCPGVSVEAAEPRGQGPRQDPEAGSPLVQVHGLHGDLRPVQAVREPRVHGPQRRGQEGRQEQAAGADLTRYLRLMIFQHFLLQAASKTSGSVLKTPVKLSDEISIIPTKKDKVGSRNTE